MMNPNSGSRAAPVDTAPLARTAPTRVEPRTPQQRAAEARSPEARPAEVRAPEVRPAEPAARTSVLGPTLRFRGELSAQEDLLIQGSVEGSITHTQCLTVGTDGSMKGDIRARVIVVDGKVDGDLYATESVSIRATAKVKGNLFAPRVGIAEGAFFQGQIEMQPSGAAVQEHSARLRQAATSAPQSEGSAPEQLRSGSQG
jgi:cytoskeletal protein CcmA (bactofilin family)